MNQNKIFMFKTLTRCVLIPLVFLTGCGIEPSCRIEHSKPFRGNGFLIIKNSVPQDGILPVVFFPACEIDVNQIKKSLKTSKEGVFLNVRMVDVWKLKKTNHYVRLTLKDEKLLENYRNVYIVPVKIVLDPNKEIEYSRLRYYQYTLTANEMVYRNRIMSSEYKVTLLNEL